MKNFIKTFLTIVYSAIAIAITVLLLSYNGYKCSVINGYTFYMLQDDMNDTYLSGDLLIIKGTNVEKVEIGDEVFLYNNLSSTEYEVVLEKVEKIEDSGTRKILSVEDGTQFDSQYLIGKASTTKSYHKLGTVLSILESRWGYLFCIVVVTLLILLQEVMDLFVELRYNGEEKKQQKIQKNQQEQSNQYMEERKTQEKYNHKNNEKNDDEDEDEYEEEEEDDDDALTIEQIERQHQIRKNVQPKMSEGKTKSIERSEHKSGDEIKKKSKHKSGNEIKKKSEHKSGDEIKKKSEHKSGDEIKKKSEHKSGDEIKKKSEHKSGEKIKKNGESKKNIEKNKKSESDENL